MNSNRDFGLELLAIAPHPDDAEIFCGGLLLSMRNRGYSTGVIDLTRGELSSQGNLKLRGEETAEATRILGLSLRENLALPDGAISSDLATESGTNQVITVVRALRRTKPEIVLAPYWEDRHPDHGAASELITKAVFHAALRKFDPESGLPPFKVPTVLYYQLRFAFRPSFLCDISSVAEEKTKAVMCFRSQFSPPRDDASQVPTLISSPHSLDSIIARDRYYGSMIGATHAEPYLLRQAISLQDPLRHFRENRVDYYLLYPEAS